MAATFANGSTARADVLVGADGIHSTVRGALVGPLEPEFPGCVAYRGLVGAERLEHLELEVTAQLWMGPGGHFVHYYVQRRQLVNFVAIIDRDTWARESRTDRGDVGDARAAFEGWQPQPHAILDEVDETFVWALFDRPPLAHWSSGRVTLLGDACHPMLPFMPWAPPSSASATSRRPAGRPTGRWRRSSGSTPTTPPRSTLRRCAQARRRG